MGATHEVPPHDDVLAERLPAQQHRAEVLAVSGADLEATGAVGQHHQLPARDRGLTVPGGELCGAAVHQQSVLVPGIQRSEEHTSELQSRFDLVCRLLLEEKKYDL